MTDVVTHRDGRKIPDEERQEMLASAVFGSDEPGREGPRENRSPEVLGRAAQSLAPIEEKREDISNLDVLPLEVFPLEDSADTLLAAPISRELARHENRIRQYRNGRLEAARAILEVHEKGLYSERGYDTITEYAKEEFGLSRARWYQLLNYAKIRDYLEEKLEGSGIPFPQSESHVRPLARLKDDPNTLLEAWKTTHRRFDSPTRDDVDTVVSALPSGGSSREGDFPKGPPSGKGDSSGTGDAKLNEARSRHAALLEGIPDGLAGDLLRIAAARSSGPDARPSDLEEAVSRYEETFYGGGDPILLAVPWGFLNERMSGQAVPLPLPEAQEEVGVLISHFDEPVSLDALQGAYAERDRSTISPEPNVQWADYTCDLVGGSLAGDALAWRSLAEKTSNEENAGQDRSNEDTSNEDTSNQKTSDQDHNSATNVPRVIYPGRIGEWSVSSFPEGPSDSSEGNAPTNSSPAGKNVVVGSSAGLFGAGVPSGMDEGALQAAGNSPEMGFLFLARPGQELPRVDRPHMDIPENVRLGIVVSSQKEIALAEEKARRAGSVWLICRSEEALQIGAPTAFDGIEIVVDENRGR